jgi:hypothetical protein
VSKLGRIDRNLESSFTEVIVRLAERIPLIESGNKNAREQLRAISLASKCSPLVNPQLAERLETELTRLILIHTHIGLSSNESKDEFKRFASLLKIPESNEVQRQDLQRQILAEQGELQSHRDNIRRAIAGSIPVGLIAALAKIRAARAAPPTNNTDWRSGLTMVGMSGKAEIWVPRNSHLARQDNRSTPSQQKLLPSRGSGDDLQVTLKEADSLAPGGAEKPQLSLPNTLIFRAASIFPPRLTTLTPKPEANSAIEPEVGLAPLSTPIARTVYTVPDERLHTLLKDAGSQFWSSESQIATLFQLHIEQDEMNVPPGGSYEEIFNGVSRRRVFTFQGGREQMSLREKVVYLRESTDQEQRNALHTIEENAPQYSARIPIANSKTIAWNRLDGKTQSELERIFGAEVKDLSGNVALSPKVRAYFMLDYLSGREDKIRRKGPTYRNDAFDRDTIERFAKSIEANEAVPFFMLSFAPKFKSNEVSGGAIMPDAANHLAFQNLHAIAAGVREIYSPGLQIYVGYEGHLHATVGGHSKAEAQAVLKTLQRMNAEIAVKIHGSTVGENASNPVQILDAQQLMKKHALQTPDDKAALTSQTALHERAYRENERIVDFYLKDVRAQQEYIRSRFGAVYEKFVWEDPDGSYSWLPPEPDPPQFEITLPRRTNTVDQSRFPQLANESARRLYQAKGAEFKNIDGDKVRADEVKHLQKIIKDLENGERSDLPLGVSKEDAVKALSTNLRYKDWMVKFAARQHAVDTFVRDDYDVGSFESLGLIGPMAQFMATNDLKYTGGDNGNGILNFYQDPNRIVSSTVGMNSKDTKPRINFQLIPGWKHTPNRVLTARVSEEKSGNISWKWRELEYKETVEKDDVFLPFVKKGENEPFYYTKLRNIRDITSKTEFERDGISTRIMQDDQGRYFQVRMVRADTNTPTYTQELEKRLNARYSGEAKKDGAFIIAREIDLLRQSKSRELAYARITGTELFPEAKSAHGNHAEYVLELTRAQAENLQTPLAPNSQRLGKPTPAPGRNALDTPIRF